MTDPQREVFTDASELDWATHTVLAHPDSTAEDVLDPQPFKTREDYEAEGWDANREGPKTRDEARQALEARIQDPNAPDTTDTAGAYDGDDDEDDEPGDQP